MKPNKFLAFGIIVCMLFGLAFVPVSAKTEGYYTYTALNGGATITKADTSISGDLTIPSTLGGYPVTSIGEKAFYNCDNLISVTIPCGVTEIGVSAFENCSKLDSVTIANSVTSIGDCAFDGCHRLTSILIPDGIRSIGDAAFFGCWSLTNIELPNSVTNIGCRAFYDCDSLEYVKLPNGITYIAGGLFEECDQLKTVIIPDGVTNIEGRAFYHCGDLDEINIPNSVTIISDGAFGGASPPHLSYNGSREDWDCIYIGEDNDNLSIFYYTPSIAVLDCGSVLYISANNVSIGNSIIFAVYDKIGKIIEVKTEERKDDCALEFEVPDNYDNIKVMLWDSLMGMQPLAPAKNQ